MKITVDGQDYNLLDVFGRKWIKAEHYEQMNSKKLWLLRK